MIKFYGFIVHSKPNNMTLSTFPGNILETRKIVFNFLLSRNVAPKPTDQSWWNSILRVPLQICPARFFFDLPLKLRLVYLRHKQTNSVTNKEFYKYVQYCFCCYVIKSAGETAKKVLLSAIWNLLLIEISLSLKLGYQTVNARKYVWCAHTFYF